MATLRTNLVIPELNGLQVTLTEASAEGQDPIEFATDFKAAVMTLIGTEVFGAPTAAKTMPAGNSGASAQSQSSGDLQRSKIVQIKVIPASATTATVEFYGNEHKQPVDEYFTCKIPNWKIETIVDYFKKLKPAVTPDFFTKAGTYNMDCEILWSYGRENSRGNRYKDFKGFVVEEFGDEATPEPVIEDAGPPEPDDIPF